MTNWYRDCTPEQKRAWYGGVAEAYDKTRPAYPPQLINRAIELTLLPDDAKILEIGCGPGTATKDFAKRGYSLVAVEPSPKACQLARQNCLNYPQVEIINTTFEEYPLQPQTFAAVLAATSFHWVSPEIVYQKAATALKAGGFLILLWNTPPQPSQEIYQQFLQSIYQDITNH
ncbi:MAG: class I SAM-dependent methyltransferase [Spirulinaceae cyanobacterium]